MDLTTIQTLLFMGNKPAAMRNRARGMTFSGQPNKKGVLTQEQFNGAMSYYKENRTYINEFMKESNISLIPTFQIDRGNPKEFNPVHWRWFFNMDLK